MATVEEAIDVLSQLEFPKQQRNERSALTLLALLDLTPDSAWSEAADPLRGITQLMNFMAEHYGKRYAPNSRETVRRQTIHQFLAAGLVVLNPDEPGRPTNSGKTVYQVSPASLRLLQAYGAADWAVELINYQYRIESLAERYALERDLQRIPVTLPEGQQVSLSPGGQNELVARIVEDFCPVFTPGGAVLYIGDADEKFAIHDEEQLENLGVVLDEHGKMPDLVVHDVLRDWLVLIEAVTSHGPVNPKRREELRDLFSASSAGLVFVTAFENRRTLAKYVADISWETEVWVAEDPTHLIHFDGERFLGPYQDRSDSSDGISISSAGERLIDEGLRMEAHPGIVFRDGPSGRRAGLAAGPDVWEVVGLLRGLRGGVEERIAAAATQLGLVSAQVRTASRYYAEFTDEIDAQIAHNDDIADRELATWENERRLLLG